MPKGESPKSHHRSVRDQVGSKDGEEERPEKDQRPKEDREEDPKEDREEDRKEDRANEQCNRPRQRGASQENLESVASRQAASQMLERRRLKHWGAGKTREKEMLVLHSLLDGTSGRFFRWHMGAAVAFAALYKAFDELMSRSRSPLRRWAWARRTLRPIRSCTGFGSRW